MPVRSHQRNVSRLLSLAFPMQGRTKKTRSEKAGKIALTVVHVVHGRFSTTLKAFSVPFSDFIDFSQTETR